jgi:hypothetical protein
MLKIAFGITIGYIFHDAIDQGIRAFTIGMNRGNQYSAEAQGAVKPKDPS